jgi:hypothetical protein
MGVDFMSDFPFQVSGEVVKPLLVGELNPYGPSDDYALYPDPPGCTGWRLCYKVLELTEADYLEKFDRTNLCSRKWSNLEACYMANIIRNSGRQIIIMLGRKVTKAFGLAHVGPFEAHHDLDADAPQSPTYIVLPHPSGLCREWHVPGAFLKARELVAKHKFICGG